MTGKNEWAEPESFPLVFRLTTQKYAKNLLKKGEIKFSTPNSWVKYAFEKGDGRGDKFEGTIATCNILDIERLKELNLKYQKYPDLVRIPIGKRVYLKKSRDMELPCFCFYVLKYKDIECPDTEGIHKLTRKLPPSYFRDFADNKTLQEVAKLNEDEKPSLVLIENYQIFQQRIINTLIKLGVKREEIIIDTIDYIDFNKYGENSWWDFGERKPPTQLTIKDIRFENQSEARIIINTDNEEIKRILSKPIEIGSLEDIAQVSNRYLYEGLYIEFPNAYVYLK